MSARSTEWLARVALTQFSKPLRCTIVVAMHDAFSGDCRTFIAAP
jgi:hypothetical protein